MVVRVRRVVIPPAVGLPAPHERSDQPASARAPVRLPHTCWKWRASPGLTARFEISASYLLRAAGGGPED